MQKRVISLMAAATGILSLAGCPGPSPTANTVKVIQTPQGISTIYVKEGDTVVFPLWSTGSIATGATYTVKFDDGESPCAATVYSGTAQVPPQCTIVAQPAGTSNAIYFYDLIELTQSKPPSSGAPAPVGGPTAARNDSSGVVRCHQCLISVAPGTGKNPPSHSPTLAAVASSNVYRSNIGCNGTAATATSVTAEGGDQVLWFKNGVPPDWTITFTQSLCVDGNGQPVNSFNNDGPASCQIAANPTVGSYQYSVTATQCGATAGTGTITIAPPTPATAPTKAK